MDEQKPSELEIALETIEHLKNRLEVLKKSRAEDLEQILKMNEQLKKESLIDLRKSEQKYKELYDKSRRAEEVYRSLLHTSADAVVLYDMEGKTRYVNPSFTRIFGWTLEDIEGKQILFLPDSEKEETMAGIKQIMEEGIPIQNFETKRYTKDDRIIDVSISGSRYNDHEGKPSGLLSVLRDTSEKKRLQAQLQQALKMEAIGTLAGGIAHDFNNILSPIMIHSEMAMMELPPDNPVQYNLKAIFKSGERARDMVKQILTFSRKEEGKRAEIKIIPVLKEVLNLLRSSIPTTIDIHQDLKAESCTVLADPTQIHQIILNLGTNAAHAMRENGGTLKVSLVQENLDSEAAARYSDLDPGSYLKLTVSDTGHGIDGETMQKIFNPYFTTKGPGEGSGMGLAVIHGIVKSYGGNIIVESEPGKGATFNVYLPRIGEDVSPVAELLVQFPKGSEKILFVDDEKDAVDAIEPMLQNLGYTVSSRTSSIEALEAFRNNPDAFDLVITDQTMPNMTGKDLAKELMVIRPDIPIILCTGFSEKIDERRAKEMGIRAFVMKPIVMRQIAQTIREVLD